MSSVEHQFRSLVRACRILTALLPCALIAAPADEMAAGYDHFYNLEYSQAIACFEKAAAHNPSSPSAQNGIAQSVLYREMLRTGALDSELVDHSNSFLRRPKMDIPPEAEASFTTAINKALSLSQQALDKAPRDLEALHARAVSYAYRSNWDFLVHKAWYEALSDATASRKCEDRILAIDPGDPDAPLGRGVHEYIIGGLPWALQRLSSLAGFHGDKAKGLQIVEGVARHGRLNRSDAAILLCAFYRRDGLAAKAIPLLSELIDRYPRNQALRFELARTHADLKNRSGADRVVDEIERLRTEKVAGFVDIPRARIAYERADIQFRCDSLEEALASFRKTAALFDANLNTRALMFMRMGQVLDLMNQHKQAVESYRTAIAAAPLAETAAESRRYLSVPYHR